MAVVKILLEHGADVYGMCTNSLSVQIFPLQMTDSRGHVDVSQIHIAKRCKWSQRTKSARHAQSTLTGHAQSTP